MISFGEKLLVDAAAALAKATGTFCAGDRRRTLHDQDNDADTADQKVGFVATALHAKIAVGINPEKRELFPIEERVEIIQSLLKGQPAVRVEQYHGLTVDFVRKSGAAVLLRGIRDVSDLRYEFQLAQANRAVGNVETVFIMTGDQYALTSSSLIRQVVALGGDVTQLAPLLPRIVVERLRKRQHELKLDHPKADAPET